MPTRFALLSIQKRQLKISRISELNVPFEWRLGITGLTAQSEKVYYETVMREFIAEQSEKYGLISFSATATDPLLWGHYADKHEGIALGFDYCAKPGSPQEMEYRTQRPSLRKDQIGNHAILRITWEDALKTKYIAWEYEEEHRIYPDLDLETFRDGHYFAPIPDDFLKVVILGARCEESPHKVRQTLDRSGFADAEIRKASLSPHEYRVLVGDMRRR